MKKIAEDEKESFHAFVEKLPDSFQKVITNDSKTDDVAVEFDFDMIWFSQIMDEIKKSFPDADEHDLSLKYVGAKQI